MLRCDICAWLSVMHIECWFFGHFYSVDLAYGVGADFSMELRFVSNLFDSIFSSFIWVAKHLQLFSHHLGFLPARSFILCFMLREIILAQTYTICMNYANKTYAEQSGADYLSIVFERTHNTPRDYSVYAKYPIHTSYTHCG